MSLRLDSYREAIRSALAGKPTIIGYYRSGAPIWAVCGFDGEGESGGESSDDKDDENTDDESDDTDKDSDDDSDDDDPKKYKSRMQAADRRASELQKRLKELEAEDKKRKDAELSDLDKVKKDLTERESEVATLKDQLNRVRVENAFLSVNTVTWHDPEDALGKINLDAIEVDENGKPNLKQLKAAIKELADKKPYLVKQQTGGSSSGASGSDMNGKRKGDKDSNNTRESLASRYPALNR